jgi:two-component system nitrate/nitrite response regulator NarL
LIRILIVDDHEIVRTGLKTFVGDMVGWDVCGEAADGAEAVAMAAQLKPDVILMDVSMPIMSGLEAARAIRESDPGIKIVLLSMHDPVHIAAAAGASVDACVSKSSVGTKLKSVLGSLAGET